MALSKDSGYYTSWVSDRGNQYSLVFVPGDVTDLTAPDVSVLANRIEMPRNVLAVKPIGESGFDSERPLGMALADKLEFTIDLSALNDIGSNDWSSLRSWIEAERSATKRTLYTVHTTRTAYIPNYWLLLEYFPSTMTYGVLFSGCQILTPSPESQADGQRELLKIQCLGLERSVLQMIPTEDISPLVTDTENIVFETYYTDSSKTYAINTYQGSSYLDINLTTLDNIKFTLDTLIGAVAKRVTRNSGLNFTFIGDFYEAWKFYTQTQTKDSSKDTLIADNEALSVISYIEYESQVIDALFQVSENSLLEYTNLWDLLKYWTEEQLMKGCFVRAISNLYFILDKIENRRSSSGATILRATLAKSAIINEGYKITKRSSLIAEGVSHVTNVPEENEYQSVIINDYTEFNYLNEGILNDDREEVELLFHNHLISCSGKLYNTNNKDVLAYKVIIPAIRCFYTQDVTYRGTDYYRKLSDYCEFTDNIDTYTPESGYNTEDMVTLGSFSYAKSYAAYYYKWLNQRLLLSGKGYVTAKALAGMFSGHNQCILETSTLNEIHDIGKLYEIDLDDLTGVEHEFGSNCQLVSIKKDYGTAIAECIFYFRAT